MMLRLTAFFQENLYNHMLIATYKINVQLNFPGSEVSLLLSNNASLSNYALFQFTESDCILHTR